MALVKLKNGYSLDEELVREVMTLLREMLDDGIEGAIAFWELVKKCRDPEHAINPDFMPRLQRSGLLKDDGQVLSSIMDIVLSAAVGDGLALHLESPLADAN
jgi:hypothetical protein